MNSLLNKFNQVEIKNDTRISELDKKYCENQEKLYREAITVMQQALESFKKVYESYPENVESYERYINNYDDIRHLEKRIEEVKNSFIGKIIYHFEKAYNVTLNASEFRKKYDIAVTYQDVIDEIFEQLGGFNFEEKAVQEIKDNIRELISRYDRVEVNKNKLTITGFVYIDHFEKKWSNKAKMEYGSVNKMRTLFKALSHFETDSQEIEFYYNSLLESFRQTDCFIKYEIGYNSVRSIKPFQNGKVEITFETNEQAQKFKSEYLTK